MVTCMLLQVTVLLFTLMYRKLRDSYDARVSAEWGLICPNS